MLGGGGFVSSGFGIAVCGGSAGSGIWGDLLLWPERSFTKICIVSSSEVLELRLEMLELRRMVGVCVCLGSLERAWMRGVEMEA